MDLLQYYKTDDRIIKLAGALSDYKAARIHLKGLIGSSDAMVALALYKIQKQGNLFVLPDREEAIYFQNDLENIFGHRVLLFPSSYKKPFDITQLDTSAVLQRAEVLNELKYNTANGKLIVSYPEAIAEKVVDQQVLAANTLEINLAEKISIETINEFLYDFDFERVDFVYEAGQFAIRGGIVDIFSYSNELPYRIEFFGDHIESIRTFETENQLSIEQINSLTIVPNIQSKLINTQTVSFLNYIDKHANLWIKDVQFTLDIIKAGYPKSIEIFEGLSAEDKILHPAFLDPQYVFQNNHDFENAFDKFNLIEFGKQYYYQPSLSLMFNMKPQTSFNKDFNLLIHHLRKNENEGLVNYIFAEQQKQIERLYSIFEDISSAAIKKVSSTRLTLPLEKGF